MEKSNIKYYPVLPLRNTVLFPNQIIPIYIGREQSLKLISDVADNDNKTIVVVAQKDGSIENPKSSDLYQMATIVTVMKIFDMPDNSKSAIVKGIERVKINDFIKNKNYFECTVMPIKEIEPDIDPELQSLTGNLKSLFSNLIACSMPVMPLSGVFSS